jgi:hypothetical protein
MTQAAIRLKTRVLPGNRIEVSAPELIVGEEVDVTVAPSDNGGPGAGRKFNDVIEFLDSLPPVERTPEEWARLEKEFQEERRSWDR